MNYWTLISPLGRLMFVGDEHGLRALSFQDGAHPLVPPASWREASAPFGEAIRQLGEYFSGKLSRFDLVLAPQGTPFQQSVWRALQTIPYGETLSYLELSRRIGRPNSARAVGAANGRNPIPIIIPCHRVIGANGSLTGFGGGLDLKRRLLVLEGALLDVFPDPRR